ncbi:Fis family transcriptional regulator [Enterococcus faecium UC8668]|uniref:helix-turn-helix domain-containing protein n=1 Tax=Enterococcus faecium TaxID=1352 RepID=UPI00040CBFBD|nr:helix-turn-helix domain-containing protein [Enterococcus faecium]KEI48507.1 Fis family transcriptional regulator [Enterococcus faecium UC8668]
MKMNKLLALYPQAQKKNCPTSEADILSFAVDDAFIWIKSDSLSQQETSLLKALFPIVSDQKKHPWYHYLFKDASCIQEKSFRLIQLHVESKGEFLKKEWQDTILELFRYSADFFFYTDTDALLIEQKNCDYLDAAEINGIFLSLDADFDTTTSVFVGSFHSPGSDLVPLFAEERRIFLTEQNNLYTHSRTFSMQDVALHYYTKDVMKDSALIKSYIELIKQNEMEEIIQELWNELGNVSSAAKTLFLHRNTLKYRIEKFQEQSGFNLKKANDLLFCYLLLIHEHD